METIDFNEVIRDPETISVVGGLIGVATSEKDGLMSKNGYMYRGTIASVDNLGQLIQSGFYHVSKGSGDTSSWPTDFPSGSALLEVFDISYSAGTRICQRLTIIGEITGIYERFFDAKQKWGEWALKKS